MSIGHEQKWIVLAFVAAIGCTGDDGPAGASGAQGSAGPAGAAGAPGERGPQGVAGPGSDGAVRTHVVYKDATGAILPILYPDFTTFAGPGTGLYVRYVFADARGFLWTGRWRKELPSDLDVEALQSQPLVLYASVDCGGTPYASPPDPRIPFQIPSPPSFTDVTYHVMPDNAASVARQIASYADASCNIATCAQTGHLGCSCAADYCRNFNSPQTTETVPLADTIPSTPIVKPALPGVGRPHPEFVSD